MKVGDLVRWDRDGDMGIILNFVRGEEGDSARYGNPIIRWFLHPYGDGIDDSIDTDDPDLEVISESGRLS
jgi:hypothetical protein